MGASQGAKPIVGCAIGRGGTPRSAWLLAAVGIVVWSASLALPASYWRDETQVRVDEPAWSGVHLLGNVYLAVGISVLVVRLVVGPRWLTGGSSGIALLAVLLLTAPCFAPGAVVLFVVHSRRPGLAMSLGVLGFTIGATGLLAHWVGPGMTIGSDPDARLWLGPAPAVATSGFSAVCAAIAVARRHEAAAASASSTLAPPGSDPA